MSIHSLARHLVALGHGVTVLATNANGPRTLDVPLNQPVCLDGVEVWYFPKEARQMPWPLSRMAYFSKSRGVSMSRMQDRVARQRAAQFDVLSIQNPFSCANRVGARAARKAGVPYAYDARGMLQPSHLRYRAMKKRVHLALREKPILRHAGDYHARLSLPGSGRRRLAKPQPAGTLQASANGSRRRNRVGPTRQARPVQGAAAFAGEATGPPASPRSSSRR